jgi:hypothetical protein
MESTVSAVQSTPWIYILLFLGMGLIVTSVGILSYLTQNKDNSENINAKIGAVTGVASVAVILFGIVAYIYFTTNKAYMTNFILIMTFLNMLLSIIAVSTAVINVTAA